MHKTTKGRSRSLSPLRSKGRSRSLSPLRSREEASRRGGGGGTESPLPLPKDEPSVQPDGSFDPTVGSLVAKFLYDQKRDRDIKMLRRALAKSHGLWDALRTNFPTTKEEVEAGPTVKLPNYKCPRCTASNEEDESSGLPANLETEIFPVEIGCCDFCKSLLCESCQGDWTLDTQLICSNSTQECNRSVCVDCQPQHFSRALEAAQRLDDWENMAEQCDDCYAKQPHPQIKSAVE